MTTATREREGVTRLLDIVVEEVSLVDRAANKQRFLIEKRSNDMDENTSNSEELGANDGEESSPTDNASGDIIPETDTAVVDDAIVVAAVGALERLTDAVETLTGITGNDARSKLGDIAGELQTLAERLAETAGHEDGSTSDAAGTEESASGDDELGTAIESVHATLAQIGAIVEQIKTPKAQKPESPTVPDSLPKDLTTLTGAVKKLTNAMKTQGQRLGRLEKRFGLPNSTQNREQPTGKDNDEVGWPLDLNRPFDRENVDKSMSFHEV